MQTDNGLYILQLYRSKNFIDLELQILKLTQNDLVELSDIFLNLGLNELSEMLSDRKLIY